MSDNSNDQSSFTNFVNSIIKSFSILVIIFTLYYAQDQLIMKTDKDLMYVIAFVCIATFMMGILGSIDTYMYSNIIVGIGLAMGMTLVKVF